MWDRSHQISAPGFLSMISQSEGTGWHAGSLGIPGGKIFSIFPYHSLRSVWQCHEQLAVGRSSSDKQGCKIHSQGMQAGEALPAPAATWTPRTGWEPRRHAETRSLSDEWQCYSRLILKWKVIASGLKNKGKTRSTLAELHFFPQNNHAVDQVLKPAWYLKMWGNGCFLSI